MFGNLEIEAGDVDHQTEPQEAQRFRRKNNQWKVYTLCFVAFVVIAAVISISVAFAIKWNRGDDMMLSSTTYNGNITVYYAGSLLGIMDRFIVTNFTAKYGIKVIEVAAGSGALATLLQNGANADVFISADSKISSTLTSYTVAKTQKKVIDWYTLWTRSKLGIGYNIDSEYASRFEAIANGSLPWYEAMDRNILKIGRTDPNLDPKGNS
jgi:molybdate/tungstate transport system substrate-binding protein